MTPLQRLACVLILGSCLGVNAQPGVWKVSDIDSHIYLYGTVHSLPQAYSALPNTALAALQQADSLLLELKQPSDSPQLQQALLRHSQLPLGAQLKNYLSPATFSRLQRYTQSSAQLNLTQLMSLRPWYVASLLTLTELQRLGYQSQWGSEAQLHRWAAQANKPVAGLESIDEQLGLLLTLERHYANEWITQTLSAVESGRPSSVQQLVNAWYQADIEQLTQLVDQQFLGFHSVKELLLIQRNLNWHAQLVEQLKQNSTVFVAVGTAHLVGRQGLLALMANEGYRIEALESLP